MFEFFNYYYYYLCGTKRSGSVYSSDRTRSSPQQPADRNQPAASTHSDITAHRADRDARGATRRKSLNQEDEKSAGLISPDGEKQKENVSAASENLLTKHKKQPETNQKY